MKKVFSIIQQGEWIKNHQSLILKKQFCAWNGSNWVVSEIPLPPFLEAPSMPDAPTLTETEEPEPEPEPYVETYGDKRMAEYGSLHEQIEFITENGLDAWQTKVASIKAKYRN